MELLFVFIKVGLKNFHGVGRMMWFDGDGGDDECACHGTPSIFSEAREYDDYFHCTLLAPHLSLQPRFAHIFEEKNISRIFGNCHL